MSFLQDLPLTTRNLLKTNKQKSFTDLDTCFSSSFILDLFWMQVKKIMMMMKISYNTTSVLLSHFLRQTEFTLWLIYR